MKIAEFYFFSFRNQKAQIKVLAGQGLFLLRENLFLVSSLVSGGCQPSLASLGLQMDHSNPCFCQHGLLPVSLCPTFPCSYKDTNHLIGAHCIPVRPHFNLISTKILFPNSYIHRFQEDMKAGWGVTHCSTPQRQQ